MILVKTFCGCISLQTGTIVIGSLSLGTAILNTVFMALHIYKLHTVQNEPFNGILLALKMLMVSALIYCLLSAVVSTLLIVGSAKRHAGRVFPWLAISFGSIVTSFCIVGGFSIIAAMELPMTGFLLLLVCSSAAMALPIYLWQVVYSYYKELVAEKFGHKSRPNDGKIIFSPPYQHV